MVVAPTIAMIGGFLMPMIGLGTWMASNETELENALDTALSAGYRHIDTAFLYQNEHVVGRVLNRWMDEGRLKREDVFVTTKLPFNGIHVDRVEMFMNKSLTNLGLDYVDLYLIHFPVGIKYTNDVIDFKSPLELDTSDHVELWKKMEEQVDAGRAKAIGVSNFNKTQVERILKSARIKPACLQVELHVTFAQKDLVDFCQRNDMVVVAYSPFGNPSYKSFLSGLGIEQKNIHNLFQHPVVNRIAKKHHKNPSHVLIRYLIEKNIVALPKSVHSNRIIENINVFDFSLDSEDMKALDALDMGEDGRVIRFEMIPKFRESPEWPFVNLK